MYLYTHMHTYIKAYREQLAFILNTRYAHLYEEEDTCQSYEEEDTCQPCEEEDRYAHLLATLADPCHMKGRIHVSAVI